MALIDVATLAQDAAFRDRLTAAIVGGALDVLLGTGEPVRRLDALASASLHQRDVMTDRMAWGVADRLIAGGAASPPTDAQIKQALGAVWPAFAGSRVDDGGPG